jgi:hypothetical protein
MSESDVILILAARLRNISYPQLSAKKREELLSIALEFPLFDSKDFLGVGEE